MFHGVGRIIYPNKSVVEGIWYNGELLEPKVYFNDGIYYDPENWDYLKFPDRRYLSEKFRGLLPDNDPQLTNEHPARPLPEGCYDTGEGYYSVKTKCLHDPHTGTYIRIPTALEARWIIENCRSSEDHNVPFMSHMFPAQYNVFYPREDLVLDPIWFNQTYPQLDSEITKAVRTEIIGDIDQLRYCLTRETMLKYCIPILQKDSPKSYPAFERHRVRDLAPWVMNVPESFGMFIISPEIALQKICIGEIKQRTNLELLKDYNDEKLEFNKFIKVLNKIDAFINGRNIIWDVKTEARVLNALQTFHYLDECIANGALTLNRIHKKGKLNKRFIVKALKLWTEGKSPENKLIQTKHVEVYARKLRRYKRFLLETKLSSTTYTSADSPTEFYPKLEMYAPYNWKMSTINKIKREKHIIFAHKSDRN
ncbi:hypothetical protein O3M35_001553 [Rhynocoris fuscipes]|uniref:Uncharacterized protein n=1 Tax=Rhynocoris fuscipes TaxID=488301 RepID=A0AAW1CRZ6_9HEMI